MPHNTPPQNPEVTPGPNKPEIPATPPSVPETPPPPTHPEPPTEPETMPPAVK